MAKSVLFFYIAICIICLCHSKSKDESKSDNDGEKWKKKDIRDYSEADMERLLEQWEDNDEDELEPDELPEWKKEPPKVDMSKLDPSDPESFMKNSKKGRTLMMFASVSGNPTEAETEKISSLWHTSLFNAHIDTQRYVVGDNRVLFMLTDGSMAFQVRDFLVKQERCSEVSIEGQNYPGAGATDKKENEKKNKSKAQKKKTEL